MKAGKGYKIISVSLLCWLGTKVNADYETFDGAQPNSDWPVGATGESSYEVLNELADVKQRIGRLEEGLRQVQQFLASPQQEGMVRQIYNSESLSGQNGPEHRDDVSSQGTTSGLRNVSPQLSSLRRNVGLEDGAKRAFVVKPEAAALQVAKRNLKKVNTNTPKPFLSASKSLPEFQSPADPNEVSMQDLLRATAAIREAVAPSESGVGRSEDQTSSW
jgi:hypothetical protein